MYYLSFRAWHLFLNKTMIEPMEDGPPPETEPRRLLSPIVRPSSMGELPRTLRNFRRYSNINPSDPKQTSFTFYSLVDQ